MIITRKEWEEIQKDPIKRKKLECSNPCITNDPNTIRVGEVFDEDLGHWREARDNDF